MATPLSLLLIEDSELDAALILRLLRNGGYQPRHRRVQSRAELLAALDSGPWDLALADYTLPGFSGVDALSLVRQRGVDLPVLFVSATIGEEVAVEAMKLGARDYIMKGNLSRLLPAIHRELQEARLRREHQQFELRMRQLEKFESLGKLAGGIAHDFNNVLGAIIGWSELGEHAVAPSSPAAESFRQIRLQSERTAGLTRQLLAYARRQVLEPRLVDLNRLLDQTSSLIRTVVGSKIDMQIRPAADLLPTRADPSQIDRVFMNLCLNARDAMPGGGRLLIETRNAVLEDRDCLHSRLARPGRYVLASVSDTGAGIDPATLEHLFEPFFTTKPEGQGTGLGLATSLGIVTQHGGFIDVSSQPGHGSVFRVYLPAAPPQEAPPVPEARPRGGSETILVVEDHEGMRDMAGQVLDSYGYRALFARDGAEAVDAFRANSSSISLVITDVSLPGPDGFQVFRQLRQIRPGVPVLFVSGHSRAELQALAPGNDVLQKPFSPRELAARVREILDRAPR